MVAQNPSEGPKKSLSARRAIFAARRKEAIVAEETKTFPLGDLLSFTDGALLSRGGMAGVQRLADHMVGSSVFTHQLLIVAPAIKEAILAQHPELAEVKFPGVAKDVSDDKHESFVFGWLAEQEERLGNSFPLVPMTDAPDVSTPLADLVELMGVDRMDRIVVVTTDGEN